MFAHCDVFTEEEENFEKVSHCKVSNVLLKKGSFLFVIM